jgi:Protein of unknown function (DUF1565)
VPTLYVDPVNGSDSNPGTQALPFKTIAHAEATVDGPSGADGETVVLAAGSYDATNQTTFWATFQRPAFVVGAGSASTILLGSYQSEQMYFVSGGGISGVTLRHTTNSLRSDNGSFAVSDVVLDGVDYGPYLIGNTVATLNPMTIVNLPNAGGSDWACLRASNTASVTWHNAGTVTSGGIAHSACIFIDNAAQVSVDSLTLTNFVGPAALVDANGTLTVTNSTITNVSPAAGPNACSNQDCVGSIELTGGAFGMPGSTLNLSGTSITGSPGVAVSYVANNATNGVVLTLTNSHLDGNAYGGLWLAGINIAPVPLSVVANGTTFSNNGIAGIESTQPTILSVTGGAISGNGLQAGTLGGLGQVAGGIALAYAGAANQLTLRSATLASNAGNGITLAGTATTTGDLGTTASPGGNTFSGVPVGAGLSAFDVTAVIGATAVGNTWMPSTQGSDSSGHYTTATVITGPASGLNVNVPAGGSVVMK